MNTINRINVFAAAFGLLVSACGSATDNTETLAKSSSALVGTDTFLYFTSNATSWNVDETTRLYPFANGFARLVNVTQPWMVSGGDTALVVETNQLDGWGTSQTFSGAATKLLVETGSDALAPQQQGSDAHFNVKYVSTGTHRVFVDTTSSPRTIRIEPATCPSCPEPLHCSFLQNSTPTCS